MSTLLTLFCYLLLPFSLLANSNVKKIVENPQLYLNPQDAPIFYEDNPLTGLHSFSIGPLVFLQNPKIRTNALEVIEKELGAVGKVVRLKDTDMRGFGAGNLIVLQIGDVSSWDGSKLPISRVSLNLETPVVMSKTGLNTFPMIWSINAFCDFPFNKESEGKFVGGIQKLVSEFAQNYQYANPHPEKTPIFYLYE